MPKKPGVSKQVKAGLHFPISRIGRSLKIKSKMKRCGESSAIYLAAVLEYVTAEIMELGGNICRDSKRKRLTPEDISMAIRGDPELAKLCAGMSVFTGDKLVFNSSMLKPAATKSKKPAEEKN